ncbi:hypothetical protein JCM5353_005385 [Sporobolomyces roseus]
MDQPHISTTLSPADTVISPTNDPTETEKSTLPPPIAPSQDPTLTQYAINGDPFEIEFLLMGGQRKRWTVGNKDTVEQVRQRIWKEWPQEWRTNESPVSTPDSIRLLYLGRFLEPTSPISAYNLKPPSEEAESVTIVHLHVRSIPTATEQDDTLVKPKRSSSSPMCRCCIVS